MVDREQEDGGRHEATIPHRWEALLRAHGGKVQGYLRRRFPSFDEEARYDLLVDALIAFQRTYDASRGAEGPWLLLLAHQRAVQRLRSQQREMACWSITSDDVASIKKDRSVPPVESAEVVEQVWRAVDRLAPMERVVIEADLEASDGGGDAKADARALAGKLGCSVRAVYSARARAREKLAAWLAPWFERSASRSAEDDAGDVHDSEKTG